MTADLSAEAAARNVRFGEKAKFLPVAFVCANIVGLWTVYTFYHCIPLVGNSETHSYGVFLMVLFNIDTLFLLICYIRCILVHPGTIPDKDEDPSWEYAPQDGRMASHVEQSLNLQEAKRSGDRRHCKWCAKYKPDRCHHCRVCRMCILKMDHHCPWIYNCVGFKNHKYFFLLLLYTTVATHMIFWTMLPSVMESVDADIPFMSMFMLLFGETLAAFLGLLVTVFFGFHIWLMLKAMSTIEFCEKSMKRTGYDGSAYDRCCYGNICAVLGDNPLLWLLPISSPSGRGLYFAAEETKLTRDMEPGRGVRRKLKSDQGVYSQSSRSRTRRAAGTGSAPSSGQSCQDEDEQLSEDSDHGHGKGAQDSSARAGKFPGYGV